MNKKKLFANWQLADNEADYEKLLVEPIYSRMFRSKPYNRSLRIMSDNESYINQLSMEYESVERTGDNFNTFVYLTKNPNSKLLSRQGCVNAFVNINKGEIVINGVDHYGYFKSVLLGVLGFFDEMENLDNLSIHAALISIGGVGTMFIAPSGRGKSTYSLGLRDEEGFTLISDDWIIVDSAKRTGKRGDLAMRMGKDEVCDFTSQSQKVEYFHHPSECKVEVMPEILTGLHFGEISTIDKILFLENTDCQDKRVSIDYIFGASYHVPFNIPKGAIRATLLPLVHQIVNNRSRKLMSIIDAAEVASLDIFTKTIQQNLDFLRGWLKNG